MKGLLHRSYVELIDQLYASASLLKDRVWFVEENS